MTHKHTPGPWTADGTGLITAGPNRLHIAQIATTGMGHAAEANAHLIAAAPKLVNALHYLEMQTRLLAPDDKEHPIYKTLQTARAVLNEAKTGA